MLIAMNRKVQHTKNVTINQKYHQQDILLVALVEHLLRALAVVDVDVDDHHSLGETLLDAVFGCYRHVVEKAIAVVFVLHGVVTWRSHEWWPRWRIGTGSSIFRSAPLSAWSEFSRRGRFANNSGGFGSATANLSRSTFKILF
jgi:hypothetical protein